MNKVLYIGNSFQTAAAVNDLQDVQVVAVIYQPEKVSLKERVSLPEECEIIEVTSKEMLKVAINRLREKFDFAVMYSFGIILPEEITNSFEIYNFHPGDLRSNRGNSPINWSILLDHRKTKMTLYRVSSAIDLGEVVCEHTCEVYLHDVPRTLSARMTGEIPSMVLELLSFRQERKSGYYITEGIYRPRIREEDYTICVKDDVSTILAKIRSQYDFEGAIFEKNGCRNRVKNLQDYLDLQ